MKFLKDFFIKTNNNENANISDEDLASIMELRDTSENIIRNEMNFLKYYESELKNKNRVELKCFEDNGALYKLILNVYATYEFSIKMMLLLTLEKIDKENIKVEELTNKLRALYFREGIEDLKRKLNGPKSIVKEVASEKVLTIFEHIQEDKTFSADDNMIDTKSNLNYDILCDIISYFDFDARNIEKYKPYINSLVHHRNNVAHGNWKFTDSLPRRMMPFNINNFENHCEKLISLIKDIYVYIEGFIIAKKYKLS
ncbi:MAE_28990/MAE_18760 family HEPN-like nuclease [Bacillus cereus]